MVVLYVQTALGHLKLIKNRLPNQESSRCVDLEVLLGLLRTFYMLGRKWGKSENCDTSLLSIEEVVKSTCLNLSAGDDDPVIGKKLRHLQRDVSKPIVHFYHSFWREMEESCLSSSYRSLVPGSSTEEVNVIDILESLLHNMQDLLHYSKLNVSIKDHMKRLEELVRFLRNFFLLATCAELNDGQMEGLLTHINVLVLDITRFTFSSWYYNSPDIMWYMQLKEKIVPYESNICGIYVQVLQCVKASGLSLPTHLSTSQGNRLVLGDFVDSLLGLSWNPLYYHSHYAETFNRQLQNLYGGLALLRTILRDDHQRKFDKLYEEMHDCIVVMICEAGNILCLFIAEECEGLEGLFSDFEKNYKLIKGEKDRYEYPSMSASSFPQTDLLGFVYFVLQKLELCSLEKMVSLTGENCQTVLYGILTVKNFLLNAMALEPNQNEDLDAIWSRVVSVAYDAEFVLDSLVAGDALQSLLVLNNITKKIDLAEALGDIPDRRREIISSQIIAETGSEMTLATEMQKPKEDLVVGLDEETKEVIEQLKSNKKSLDIVSIVGMPGLGKTTLAKRVYSDAKITQYFQARSWCCVSQVYNQKSLLLEILRGLNITIHSEKSAFDLADMLRRHLKGIRYLIVLDDVWSIEAWKMLRESFPDDGKGNRILLTSRNSDVASNIWSNGYHCIPHFLTKNESWELMENELRGCPPELLDLGMKIAQHCKGLPLMILIVAGFLSKMERKRATWEEVEENLGKVDLPVDEQYQKTLNLSYHHLPDYLKSCFLSFGAFQEDRTIPVRELIWLWVADGAVGRAKGQFSEIVAEKCITDLIQRNLVMVDRKGSSGKVKSCLLHDLLHDFCKKIGNREHFLHGLHGPELGTSIEPSVLYRLCVHFQKKEDFEELRLLCPRLRNLSMYVPLSDEWFPQHRYDIFYKIALSKLLRVLDLRGFKLGPFFPGAIELLVHLKFLALNFLSTELSIPSSIDKLSNLETFIVKGVSLGVLLPDTVWNMKTLRHMCTARPTYWKFPGDNPEYQSKLENLSTLSSVAFSCQHDKEEVLGRVPNVRTMKYAVAGECTGDCKLLALGFMGQLESLNISQAHAIKDLQFQFPGHLKELVLSGFQLPWSNIEEIYKLPNLEVLKLLNGAFEGTMWEMEMDEDEQVFSKLRALRLSHLDLDTWEASNHHFPSLVKVTLHACPALKEIPPFLGEIATLDLIEVDSGISLSSIEKFEDEFDAVKVKRI